MNESEPGTTARRFAARTVGALPILVALGTFVALLPALASFGPTWDMCIGEIAHGELYLSWMLTGDARFLDFSDAGSRPIHHAPHPDFERGLYLWFETNPFMGLWSALSCRALWTGLGVLPAMAAHLLPSLVLSCFLLFVSTRFLIARAGIAAAIGAVAATLLAPRFLYDALANPKDGPEACLYALAMFAVCFALERGSTRRWIVAGIAIACALAQKPNALFLPFHSLAWFAVLVVLRRARGQDPPKLPLRGVIASAIAFAATYLAFSPMLWTDTVARLVEHFGFFARAGTADAVDDFPAWRAVLVTTPEIVLALAAIGAFTRLASLETRLFLVLGAAFPVLRASFVGGVNFDGVRHFLEFHPFLAALSGLGFSALLDVGRRVAATNTTTRLTYSAAVSLALLFPLAGATASTWPYGLVYFNSLAGGFGGIQRDGHREASDYWAASYWEGLDWIESHARPGSIVIAPIAPHVARSIAPLRLGRNARLTDGEPPVPGGEIYVIQITRRILDSPVADHVAATETPCHEIRRDGGVLSRIYRLDDPARAARALELLRVQTRSEAAFRRARAWLLERPEMIERLRERVTAEPHRTAEILAESIPDEVRADILEFLKRVPLDRLDAAGPSPDPAPR